MNKQQTSLEKIRLCKENSFLLTLALPRELVEPCRFRIPPEAAAGLEASTPSAGESLSPLKQSMSELKVHSG
jgi:hypothetical protein